MSHCLHYGMCGGCATDNRAGFDKVQVLQAAFSKAGFTDASVSPLVEVNLGTRRRVDLAVTRVGGAISLGLHKARGADVVDMTECVLLDERVLRLLPPLRVLLRGLEALRRVGSVVINYLDTGADIFLRMEADATEADRRRMIAFARAEGVLRISIAKGDAAAELVAMLAPPIITLSGVKVQPAPGAFLQASAAGEAAIIGAVLDGLPKLGGKARVIELYAGIGTLTFALAARARVEAYEGAEDAVAAHEIALRAHGLAGRVTLTQRDLARRPLQAVNLAGRAAIVLDPPYAGAARQMPAIAASGVACVIYVSCNPAALANDAFLLRRAGYEVVRATPIDQFPYSENLESVVVFGNGVSAKK